MAPGEERYGVPGGGCPKVSPRDTGTWEGTVMGVPGGTGSMHGAGGQAEVPWRYGIPGRDGSGAPGGQAACTGGGQPWGPRGTCSTHRGLAAVPNGISGEGRQRGPRETGSMPGGDPPQSQGPWGGTATGRRGGGRGSWGGGQRGCARPEECGRPGSPGAAAAPCASRPGPRRRWWVWENCRCALGQPPAAAPRACRGPPRPRHGSHSSRISFFPF